MRNIFSLITLNKISFDITIFDLTSIIKDDIIKIIEKLNNRNILKKKANLKNISKMS